MLQKIIIFILTRSFFFYSGSIRIITVKRYLFVTKNSIYTYSWHFSVFSIVYFCLVCRSYYYYYLTHIVEKQTMERTAVFVKGVVRNNSIKERTDLFIERKRFID